MNRFKVLEREFIVSQLTKLFDKLKSVELAVLFGSLAKSDTSIHDVDVAIKFAEETSLLDLGYLVAKIAEALNINEEFIDIVDLDHVYPLLLLRILDNGIIIKGSRKELEKLLRRAEL